MKINFIIFLLQLSCANITDGKFTDYIMKGKKYYKIATLLLLD